MAALIITVCMVITKKNRVKEYENYISLGAKETEETAEEENEVENILEESENLLKYEWVVELTIELEDI